MPNEGEEMMADFKPRTLFEKQKAKQSLIIFILFWVIALSILRLVVKIRQQYLD